jgi:hypothetical protein
MPQFAVMVPHTLGKDVAITRLHQLIERMRSEHGDQLGEMQGEWTANVLNFSFRAMGMGVKGGMNVDDDRVVVEGQLPLAAAFFRGKIEQAIRTELDNVLS